MSSRLARRAQAQVVFAGVDISASIADYLISLTFTDNEEDEADDLQIKLHDRDDVWIVQWLNSIINAAGSGAGADTTGAKIYKVKSKKRLVVRAGPGTAYPSIGKLSNGKKITVYEDSGEWARILYNQRTGHVQSKYLKYMSDVKPDAQATEQDSVSKGLKIQASIIRQHWKGADESDALDCGEFELDNISAAGPPATVTIKGTSLPFAASIRQTKKSKAWEKYTLSGIAEEMAAKYDMACLYESPYDPYYARVEQVATSDIAFLSALCHKAGLSLKTANNLLVLFDQSVYESANPVRQIAHGPAGGYTKWKLGTGESDVSYASCHVSYVDPATGGVIEAMAYSEDYSEGVDNQCLEISAVVGSIAEAETLARKMLRLHNKFEYTGSFTIPGDPELGAGMTVDLTGWGLFDGRYIISQAKHQLTSSGYTTSITIRRAYTDDGTVQTGGVKHKVSASSTAVRSGPSKKHKKLGKLKRNAIVYVLEESDGWSKITYKEKTSYVYAKHLKITE